MTTGAKHVENLSGLPEVKSLMPEWSTAARSVMSRGGVGVVSCFGSSEPADCQSCKAEKLHGRHSVSAQGAHAGGKLVQSPGGYLYGPGISPSHDEQVRSAD